MISSFEDSADVHPPSFLWYALYVKPRHEKTVAANLAAKGYRSFLPTYSPPLNTSIHLPLFPSYVFCEFDCRHALPIVTTPGVFSVVARGTVPEPIPEEELEAIKRLMASGVRPQAWPYVGKGMQVVLSAGPLRGLSGVVIDAEEQRWFVLSVHLLRRSVAVKVPREWIAAAEVSRDSGGEDSQSDPYTRVRITRRAKV